VGADLGGVKFALKKREFWDNRFHRSGGHIRISTGTIGLRRKKILLSIDEKSISHPDCGIAKS
jgi:hypothetical protein